MDEFDMFGFGFIYHPKNNKLSHSHDLNQEQVLLLKMDYPGSNNDGNLFVYCGTKVKEMSVSNQLEKENEKFLKDEELDGYGEDNDYDEYYGYLG